MSRRRSAGAWVRAELQAIRQMLSTQPHNSVADKYLLAALLFVWSVITIGIAFGYAENTPVYTMLTAVVWALAGRVWGGEVMAVKQQK